MRGLSTLIILRALLCLVNKDLTGKDVPIPPKDVFDVIVGTSTGGLIALMMVKLNLDVDQCIEQYRVLSREIFGKPSSLGKWTVGFVRPRYSGRLVRKFVIDLIKRSQPGHGENLMMEDASGDGGVHCSVLCRELENNYTKTRKSEPVFLCSHMCRPELGNEYRPCKMCDAACATSAAPTYFEPQKLLGKTLVDGGFGDTNNPSNAALDHYRIEKKSWSLPLDEQLIWINVGTGSPPPHISMTRAKRPFWSFLIPDFLLEIHHLMNDLQQIATDSEQVAKNMSTLARETRGNLQYSRFSANNGLHTIGLDDYESVDNDTIKDLTEKYLNTTEVQRKLQATAKSLADSCKRRRAAFHRPSEVNSPIPKQTNLFPVSPSPASSSPFMPDDLQSPLEEVPVLSRLEPTDEASEPPRTPQPQHQLRVQPETKSENTDTVGSGHQFDSERPQLKIIINGV